MQKELHLFPRDQVVGVFRGFKEGGFEFRADLLLPYQSDFQNVPMHGQFLLVQLESEDEAVLGRITSLSSEGKLSYGSGEEFSIRAVREEREVPDDLRQQYLRYRIDIRILGVLRKDQNKKILFAPSHRRLPHVGSKVAFPCDDLLKEIVGHNLEGATIGNFALGEFVYCGQSEKVELEDWVQRRDPDIEVHFSVQNLVSRRTFVFARAGFGKSNLNKLLFSELYGHGSPSTEKRGKKVPVGTIIFDPDGEYFWPDDKGRPGLCDVKSLENQLVVFTSRHGPSEFYQSFVAGGIRLDIRRLRPADVIAIALSPEKQDQQNVRKLRGLNDDNWARLVNLIHQNGHGADLNAVSELLQLEERQEAEAVAARSNVTTIVRMLHDPASRMIDMLLHALSQGKLCIVDVSQMRGAASLILSGLILRRIFDRNQEEFTKADPKSIPVIAVVEEAQSVLNEKSSAATPYVEWVKEGRKYDLGAVMITQQPASIPVEILSQGDNWFLFHLLSASDLSAARHANSHFSQDMLSSLLNEPIRGQGVFWSSVNSTAFPVPLRVLSFNKMYALRDSDLSRSAGDTFAEKLKKEFKSEGIGRIADTTEEVEPVIPGQENVPQADDTLRQLEELAVNAVKNNSTLMSQIKSEKGVAWGTLNAKIKEALPPTLDDVKTLAFQLVPRVMEVLFGKQKEGWTTYKNENGTTYIRTGG